LAQARSVLVVQPAPQPPPKEALAEPPKVQSPPAPRAPILSPADREAAERLIARGEREMEQGQVSVARQFFLRAAQMGLARGALLLAATYDPRELARSGAQASSRTSLKRANGTSVPASLAPPKPRSAWRGSARVDALRASSLRGRDRPLQVPGVGDADRRL